MGIFRGSAEDTSTPLAGLAPRLFTGYFFLRYGLEKVTGDFGGETLRPRLVEWASETRYGFYVPFLEHVAIPFADVIAFLVAWGEVIVGMALVIGLATRAAALLGLFLCLNFMLATGTMPLSNEEPIYFSVMLVTVYLTAAGRSLGLDIVFRRLLPRWAT